MIHELNIDIRGIEWISIMDEMINQEFWIGNFMDEHIYDSYKLVYD